MYWITRDPIRFILIVFATSFFVFLCLQPCSIVFLNKIFSLKRFAQSVFILAGDITFPGVFIFVCTRSLCTIRYSYMCDD
jgi:hypothetical protein